MLQKYLASDRPVAQFVIDLEDKDVTQLLSPNEIEWAETIAFRWTVSMVVAALLICIATTPHELPKNNTKFVEPQTNSPRVHFPWFT